MKHRGVTIITLQSADACRHWRQKFPIKYPVWDTLHNKAQHPPVLLISAQYPGKVSPGTQKMRHTQLEIACEKSGLRNLLNIMTGQQRIWFSRLKHGNSKTILPLFIGCNYRLHSLIPSHFWTNLGTKETIALIMMTLVHHCSVSQAKLFIGKTSNKHIMKECT